MKLLLALMLILMMLVTLLINYTAGAGDSVADNSLMLIFAVYVGEEDVNDGGNRVEDVSDGGSDGGDGVDDGGDGVGDGGDGVDHPKFVAGFVPVDGDCIISSLCPASGRQPAQLKHIIY